MWDRIHPPSVPSTPPLQSPGVGHWAEGVQSGGRLLPRPGAGCLPASRLALLSAAGPLPRLWWGLPSHIPSSGSRRHGDGSRVLGAAVLLRPVPGAERAGCLQELKLLCKEQRRRAEAGGDRGAAPTARLQSPPPGTEPNRRWESRARAAHPSGPGSTRLSSQGSAAGPEHPSQGRQRCRQRPRRQQQDPELRPTAPPPSPLRTPGRGCHSACSCAPWGGRGGGRGPLGRGWLVKALLPGNQRQTESSEGN